MEYRDITLGMLCKPVLRMRSSTKLSDYMNKNVLSGIVSFLTLKEISYLRMTSKGMKVLVNEILGELIQNIEFK